MNTSDMDRRTTTAALALAAATSLLLSAELGAQTFAGLSAIDEIGTALTSTGRKIINVVFVISGIMAAVALIPAGIKEFMGEHESKTAIVHVGVGAIIIFAILGVIKMVMHF